MRYRTSLEAVLRTSLDAVVVVDQVGTIQAWNAHAEDIFGWPAAAVAGQPVTDLIIPPRYRAAFAARLAAVTSGMGDTLIGSRVEVCACRRDGSEFPIELGMMSTEGEDGARLLIGFVRDLTQEHGARDEIEARNALLVDAQERLRQSEELYRYVVELSSLIPWTADAEGNILTVGARFEEWSGLPVDAALGNGWLILVHSDDVVEVERQWRDATRFRQRLEIDYRFFSTGRGYRWCRARTTKRRDGDGARAVWYGTLEDIHDQRMAEEATQRAQAELAHVSRLSAMGAMASVIAHDLNQPLTAAAQYVRGSKRLVPEQGAASEALENADRNIVHASEIVRRVREFVARGTVERRQEDLVELIEEACRLALTNAQTKGIAHRLEFAARCCVEVDRVQILQVLVNLLRNAVEALRDQPQREIVIRTGSARQDFCEVSVFDSGKGIGSDDAERMFDPFYTTRDEGMGLGLSISRMIVEAHGGTIWSDRSDEPGTTIRFTLPIAQEAD